MLSSYDDLLDVMGELHAMRSTITDRLPGAPCVMLTLRLQGYTWFSYICLSLWITLNHPIFNPGTFIMCRNVDVCVSMFDSLALAFHSKFDGYSREPRIVLVTSINPKIVSGERLFELAVIAFTCHLYTLLLQSYIVFSYWWPGRHALRKF